MKHSRPIQLCLLGLACFAICVSATGVAGAEDEADSVQLRWALGALDTNGDEPNAVRKDSQLETGTKLKFLVEPLSPGSVYLILLDSQQEIHLLYQGSAESSPDRAYVPPGRHWFELDDEVGRETFFLLASVEPLEDLDRLLAEHAAADAAAKKDLGSAIVDEIRRLHKAHRQFSRPIEKPVMIGGATRGSATGESAIDRLAVEISAERFYGKTITIDH